MHIREICSREFRVTDAMFQNIISRLSKQVYIMSISFEEILVIHRLSKGDLSQVCSKEHRDELTKRINDWKAVGVALGFTQEQLDIIDNSFEGEEQKKTVLFVQWNMRDVKEATYLNLAKLLFAGEQLELLQEVCTIVSKATPSAGRLNLSCS